MKIKLEHSEQRIAIKEFKSKGNLNLEITYKTKLTTDS